MAQNHVIEWASVIALFVFGVSMLLQGYYITTGKRGYRHCERERKKLEATRKQVEELINVD